MDVNIVYEIYRPPPHATHAMPQGSENIHINDNKTQKKHD